MRTDTIKGGLLALLIMSTSIHAGSWGEGVFDNDAAADWLYELEGEADPQQLRTVFEAVSAEGYIGAWECQLALAGSVLVHAMTTGETDQLPEQIRHWTSAGAEGQVLIPRAAEAIGRCLDDERSELAQLWRESTDSGWRQRLLQLRVALLAAH